ncbi:MAG: class I SAM-dependent methyltransferase [Candidatus Taylorbacteria bacterium]|nr:class I SAM-dependent methyltransferase [Candidatus Taylorbacteria bacterium]
MKSLIKNYLGIKDAVSSFEEYCGYKFQWASDTQFNNLYSLALEKTDTENFLLHKMRSYTLVQLLKIIPDGEIAECGVYKGTTAYEIRAVTKRPVHLFDSFEGISGREVADIRNPEEIGGRGAIACSLENVQAHLSYFSDFKYYKGWIPDRFSEVKDLTFAFVHVDVDVYKPTKDSFDFFYPRMVKGGIMVCDDYGFLQWPGCKKAVDEMADKYGFKVLPLTTGQCVIFK